MENKYLTGSASKISSWARIFAKFIDLFFVIILAAFFYPLGVILGAFYLALADSIQNGQSVGKKMIGLCVISLKDGSPCSFKQSLVRNLPFLIPLLVAIFPIWGWLLSFFMLIVLSLLEIYLMLKLESGHRLGDVMADTTVAVQGSKYESISKKSDRWFSSK